MTSPASNSPAPKASSTKRWVVGAVLVGAVMGYAGIAAAQDSSSSSSSSTTAPVGADAPAMKGSKTGGGGNGETPLTGDTADKVKAAALAANPGATVDRVETDNDGSPYEAHITKADGSHATVKVDASFAVTATAADGGRGGRGGGPGHGGKGGRGGNETALTGDTADKVKAAAQAAVPGGTVDRVETDDDGSPYEAHVTKADGSHVTVKVGASFTVTGTENR